MNRLLTGLARLPGPISPWILMRNFSLVSEMKKKSTISGDELEKENTQLAETHKL